MSTNTSLVISLFAFIAFASACTLFGLLTDFVGRKPVLIGGAISIAVITIPTYLLIMAGELLWVVVAQLLLVLPIAAVRAAGNTMAAVYGVAIAVIDIPLLAKGIPESYKFSIKTGHAS
ncbi:hypothetical protein AB0F77_22720 [Streptomyces sp. NPDC026672]|uniref:hypothetical protein n=1 Tax=unclassified Streptomyces TaxID=2593676 RepID=UPI0033E6D8E6